MNKISLIILVFASSVNADEATFYPLVRGAILTQGTAVRAVGMGEAFTAVAEDASGASWNPAGLGRISSLNAQAMYSNMGSGMSLSHLAGAMTAGPGTAGLNVSMFSFGSMDIRDENGLKTATKSPVDFSVGAAYAIANPRMFGIPGWIGLSAEMVNEAVGNSSIGAGLGILAPLTNIFTVGASVLHLGPAKGGFGLPSIARLGGVYEFPEIFNSRISADVTQGITDERTAVCLGVEGYPHAIIALRLGYRLSLRDDNLGGLSGLTVGLGTHWKGVGLDYAFQPYGALATSHRLALSWGGYSRKDNVASYSQPVGEAVKISSARSAEDAYKESVSLYTAGNYDGALSSSREAVSIDSKYWQAWQMVGNCQYAKGDRSGAIEAYRKSLESNPDNPQLKGFMDSLAPTSAPMNAGVMTPEKSYEAANASYTAQKYDEAINLAGECIKGQPNHWQAWQLIGNSQYAKGNKVDAVKAYDRALEINPDNPQLRTWNDQVKSGAK